MGARSQDSHRRGTLVRDKDGDVWRKGTAWWHWTGRSVDTGPGKLLWNQLESWYGPLTVISTPAKSVKVKRQCEAPGCEWTAAPLRRFCAPHDNDRTTER